MKLDRDQNGRLEEALDDTMEALGAALADRFPECESGDESPEMVARLRAALREYGEGWLLHNLPTDEPSMTLEQFRATGVDCDDLGKALSDAHWEDSGRPGRGRLYLGSLWIERRPEAGWPNQAHGEWFLLLNNADWLSDDLGELEARLYEWAAASGYLENRR